MSNIQAEFWNSRYSVKEFVYGSEPNEFFKYQLLKLEPGTILLPADGEGRNGVFAAKSGWTVDAVDFSSQARLKALALAQKVNVNINYQVADLNSFIPPPDFYDAVAVIFLHMDQTLTKIFAGKMISTLKPGGIFFQEVYSKNQIGKNSGGPQSPDVLYSVDELNDYYNKLNIEMLKEEIVLLDESELHKGEASVIRMIGRKKK